MKKSLIVLEWIGVILFNLIILAGLTMIGIATHITLKTEIKEPYIDWAALIVYGTVGVISAKVQLKYPD